MPETDPKTKSGPKTDMDKPVSDYYRLIQENKQLKSLYGISQIILDDDRPFEGKVSAIAQVILPVFEEAGQVRINICLDGVCYQSANFSKVAHRLSEKVLVHGEDRGCVEIGYPVEIAEKMEPTTDEKNFLKTVARQLAYKLEKRDLKDQLQHADRLATIGQLAAGIAHELNNPLTDILGFAQLASNRPDLPEETYQDLVRIVKSSLYAREVIKRMLLFSRQSRPQQSQVNLNDLLEQWRDFFEFRCAKNNIHIAMQTDADLPQISGDPAQLNQVLVNLVINAIHAMPAGGRLTISTGTTGEHAFVTIQDTGEGIKEEIFDKIFLPFFTTKDVDKGTGLGLAVVYGIVKEHGGTITVRSKAGAGATFEVRLPLQLSG